MKYKQIIQELKESHDPNVQIFLNDAEKIIRLPRKEKNTLPDFKQEAPMAAKVDRFKWARNGQGIRVKMCCASCAHKDLTRAVTKRYCSITGQCVDPLNVCEKWEMSEQMKIAGLLH